jgi:lipoprotein NlpD
MTVVAFSKKHTALVSATLVAVLLSACGAPAPSHRKAPIEERSVNGLSPIPVAKPAPTSTRKTHVVQKGDTLYSIAFVNGVDYREVAELNHLTDPSAIKIGQQLSLDVPLNEAVSPKPEVKPIVAQPRPALGGVRTQPKVGKLIYSEDALAKAERMQMDGAQPSVPPVIALHAEDSSPSVTPNPKPSKVDEGEESLEWGMPTNGKVIAGFSESANRKGVDIAGKRSQVIVASAAGKVVYSGSGLRGYGKLIIIKHNKTFLSAYAHNDQIVVKEGQSVSKGQKIAEMGNTDADQVKLHFEIRKQGKPVDPAKYLPLIKS